MAGSLCGLAGPLHGLANQESLRFIRRIKRLLGDRPATPEFIEKFVIDLLESGQVYVILFAFNLQFFFFSACFLCFCVFSSFLFCFLFILAHLHYGFMCWCY